MALCADQSGYIEARELANILPGVSKVSGGDGVDAESSLSLERARGQFAVWWL